MLLAGAAIAAFTFVVSLVGSINDIKQHMISDALWISLLVVSIPLKMVFYPWLLPYSFAALFVSLAFLYLANRTGAIGEGDVLFISCLIFALYGILPVYTIVVSLVAGTSIWFASVVVLKAVLSKRVTMCLRRAQALLVVPLLLVATAVWISAVGTVIASSLPTTVRVGVIVAPLALLFTTVIYMFKDAAVAPKQISEIDGPYKMAETIIVSKGNVVRIPRGLSRPFSINYGYVITGMLDKEKIRKLSELAKKGKINGPILVQDRVATVPGLAIGLVISFIVSMI